MSEKVNKILQKYSSSNNLENKYERINKKYKNVAVFEELDNNFVNETNENMEFSNKTAIESKDNEIIWREIYEDDNEDEIAAIHIAQKEMKSDQLVLSKSEENEPLNINRKRERHDSDSEQDENEAKDEREQSSKSSTENELDELLKDEDGDLILDNTETNIKNKNVIIELKSKKKINSIESIGIKLKQQTVFRDEMGRKVDKSETKEAKKKTLEKLNYNELKQWAMGFIQKEEQKKQKEEFNKRKDEPLTRYSVDQDVDDEMKKKQRFGDPMKEFLFSKNSKKDHLYFVDDKTKMRGFYLPKSKFAGSINRFGIEPGYRWDGVDRSTGFEKRYLEAQNSDKVREQEYHKLRTEEM